VRVKAVLAAGLLVVVVALVVVLLDSKTRQAGSNYVAEAGPTVTLGRQDRHCEFEQVVPKDAAGLRVLLGTFERPSPPLEVSITTAGGEISNGRLAGGGPDGEVVVPIERVRNLNPNATVCIKAEGLSAKRRLVLYGNGTRVRFEWVRPGRERWFDVLPTVAHRFGLGKPFVSGGWVLVAAGLLLAAAWALALRLATRELEA
jgi:hypothetical protein